MFDSANMLIYYHASISTYMNNNSEIQFEDVIIIAYGNSEIYF